MYMKRSIQELQFEVFRFRLVWDLLEFVHSFVCDESGPGRRSEAGV